MMKNLILLIAFVLTTVNAQTPLTNTFTYQGELKSGNALANGSYDFEFSVFDVETNGAVLETVTVTGVTVTNGVFTTPITLTMDLFTGNMIWLDIAVRSNGSGNPFEPLSPRQEVTSSPYAIHAQFVGTVGADAVTGVQIANGTITASDVNTSSIQSRVTGTCAAGNYIQSVNADGTVNCMADNDTLAPPAWGLGGNAASAGDFIGTLNTEPFVVRVAGKRVLYVQDVSINNDHAPSINLGSDLNEIPIGVGGATISGGGGYTYDPLFCLFPPCSISFLFNKALADFATVGGGSNNIASGPRSTISGGQSNVASGFSSSISGGSVNIAGGDYSFAGGHYANVRNSDSSGDSDGDEGTFIWSDSSSTARFSSTGPNQFLIRAIGGVGIGTNNPNGFQLNVNGNSKIQGNIDVTGTGSLGILNVTGNSNLVDLNVNNSFNVNGSSYLRNNLDTSTDADLVLGGGSTNATDDGVLTSDLTQLSSDLLMKSNDDVIITLDDNNDEVGLFQILDGLGNTLMQLSEAGGAFFEVTGSGLNPPGFHIEQKGASGVGMLIRQTSTDANLVLVNKNSGDIIKAFTGAGGGNLMFRVANNGNVTADGSFTGGGADFAEYLPAVDDTLKKGEVVALKLGKLSRNTNNAERIFVVSTAPAFVGNEQQNTASLKALVAFTGQVPVNVEGEVSVGDWLLASGKNDGNARAIPNNQIATANFAMIIGRAIENSHNEQVKVLVGLPQQTLIAVQQQTILQLQQQQNIILAQLQDTESLKQELAEIKSLLFNSSKQKLLVHNDNENQDE